jgi:hypothetical protein
MGVNDVSKEELRNKIIETIKEKRPEDKDEAENIADLILSQPYINENTYEIFMENAGLL